MFRKEEDYKTTKKTHSKHKRKTVKRLLMVISILVIVGIVIGFIYNAGFIPIVGLLNVKEPVGNPVGLDIGSYMEEYPQIGDIPNLDKIKYGIYGTDESADVVANSYKEELENEGYNAMYAGTGEIEGMTFSFIGFLKGLTAVGIITTSDASDEFGYDTVVLYATGNAFDFKEILDWYQEK